MVKRSTSQPSPLSPTLWPSEAFTWKRSLAFFGLLVAAFMLGQLLDAVLAKGFLGTTNQDLLSGRLTWGIAIGQYVSYVPLLVLLFGWLPWVSRRSLRELGLGPIDGPTFLAGVVGAIAMYAATIGAANIQYAFTRAKPQEAALTLFSSTHDTALLVTFAVLAALAAPFVEEFIFRGFLFNALLRYTPVWVAAIVSGCVFGISHGSPSAFLPLACSGVVLAYVYYVSGSLTAAMLTHGLFNVINVVLLVFLKQG